MKLINQTSPEYSGWTLGNSSLTVYDFGCAVASSSMATDKDFLSIIDNPDNFNSQGLIIWDKIAPIKDRRWYSAAPANLPVIVDYLNRGYRVIFETRFNKNEAMQHFVCAINTNAQGNDFEIADPIDGKKRWFSEKYGEPTRWIYQIVVFDKLVDENKTVTISQKEYDELKKNELALEGVLLTSQNLKASIRQSIDILNKQLG